MNKTKQHIIFGIRAISEALDAGKEFEKVLLKRERGTSDIHEELRSRLHSEQIPVQFVPVEKLNSVTRKNHQGAIAFVSEINYSEIDYIVPQIFAEGRTPFVLVLDQVSDVRNFGAIARTAECAGVDAIVVPFRGGAMINAEAMKTSAGALNHIPVCRHRNLEQLIDYLKSSGITIVAASEKAEHTIYEMQMDVPVAILMGSEEKGISETLLTKVDQHAAIPLKGKIGSLNVSVATGIVLFEVVRQRKSI